MKSRTSTHGHLQLAPSAPVIPLVTLNAPPATKEPGMEPDRLQNLENVVRELQVTAHLTLRVQGFMLEAIAKTSPATLADIHDNIGTFVNAVRLSGADPFAPITENLLRGLEQVRSDVGALLRQ